MIHCIISMDHSFVSVAIATRRDTILSFTYYLPYTVIIMGAIFLWHLSSLKIKTIKNNAASQLCFKTSKFNMWRDFFSWHNSLK